METDDIALFRVHDKGQDRIIALSWVPGDNISDERIAVCNSGKL